MMDIRLRPASEDDRAFSKRVYVETMRWVIERLSGWDEARIRATFDKNVVLAEVRMIVLNGEVIGWLQTAFEDGSMLLKEVYIDGPFQRRGIGTKILNLLFDEARNAKKTIALSVVKMSPALRLYQRLGFQTTGEDDVKLYMSWDPLVRHDASQSTRRGGNH